MSKQYLQTHTSTAHPTDIFALAVTPTQLFSASGSSSIQIQSTKSQVIHADTAEDDHPYPLVQTLEKAHPLGCHHICTSLDGKVAASIGFGGELNVWECGEDGGWSKRGQVTGSKGDKTEHWALALNENGHYLAASTHDGKIDIYGTTTLTSTPTSKLTTYETKGSFALAIDISPHGELTASGHHNGTIHLFNNATRRLAHSLAGLIKPIRAVRFSPANTYLAAAGDARIIALYDTRSGEQIANLTGHGSWVMSVDWNWSGEFLLSGGYDGKAKVWSVERRECVATQTESEKCLWSVRWLPKTPTMRNETFVTAAAGVRLLSTERRPGLEGRRRHDSNDGMKQGFQAGRSGLR